MVDPDIFNDVPIFALLDADEQAVLAQQVLARTFAAGETIYRIGEQGRYAYLIHYGQVNVSITDIAQESVIVDVVEAGGLMGMSSMLSELDYGLT